MQSCLHSIDAWQLEPIEIWCRWSPDGSYAIANLNAASSTRDVLLPWPNMMIIIHRVEEKNRPLTLGSGTLLTMNLDPLSQAEAHLERVGLIDSPGAVLYSAAATLCPGPVYLLGLNPGGSEGATLRDSINRSRMGHNAYLDEQWAPGGHVQPMGQATLQRRVQNLCTEMGLDTRSVPASNLVFTRSIRKDMHLDFPAALALCLPAHKIFLEAIRPHFLMTFGSMDNFRGAVTVTHAESRSAEHGTWQAHRGRAIVAGREIAFGNIPHMSLWASDKRGEIVRWAIAHRA